MKAGQRWIVTTPDRAELDDAISAAQQAIIDWQTLPDEAAGDILADATATLCAVLVGLDAHAAANLRIIKNNR